MKPALPLVTLALALTSAPVSAETPLAGRIDTLDRGEYICELPGDAASQRGIEAPEQSFTVTNASAYVSNGKRGKYLRLGDNVTMTSGPLKGNRYALKSDHFLRLIGNDGQPTGLRCVKER